MIFTEFIEAICRVCDELEIPHLVDDADFLSEHDRNNPEFIELWGNRPLSYKIESFLLICAKNCFGPKYYIFEALPNLVKMKEQKHLYANDIEVSGNSKDMRIKIFEGIMDRI